MAFTDQVLLTVLHQRLGLAIEPLAVLFGTSRTTAYRTTRTTRTTRSIGELLDQHGIHITPAPSPPGPLRVLHERVLAEDSKATNKIKAEC
nr:transposase family protein [Spongiactinospora gelatinilytica]